jgi:hypothetical protein
MTVERQDRDELHNLLRSMEDGGLSADGVDRIDALVRNDIELLRSYVEYTRLVSDLHLGITDHRIEATLARVFGTEDLNSENGRGRNPRIRTRETSPPSAAHVPPISSQGWLSATLDGTLSYFPSGWPVAYLVATLIFAIGLLVGARVYVSQPGQYAITRSPSVVPVVKPTMESVGRINGIVDCRWATGSAPPLANEVVSLGRDFKIESGIVEIGYNTGARVILQGPVSYVVESKNGGFLNTGKLTCRVGTQNAKGFSVRTPTAVVTDLGTEFGIEVDTRGHTTSHVFRGIVNLHPVSADGESEVGDILLHENESACVETNAKGSPHVTARRIAPKPDGFTRSIESKTSSPVQVLAWFRMGEDEPGAAVGAMAGKQIHDHRNHVRLDKYGSPRYSSDTQAADSVLSMTFSGGDDGECFHSSRFPYVPNDYFILEAWVKLHKLGSKGHVVVASGRGAKSGYCLAIVHGRWHGVLEAISMIDSGVACDIGKWTHLALVCERGKSQLWINGTPVGKVIDELPIMPDGRFTIGGSPEHRQNVFNGEIDEVRLSTFIAPFRPEMLLFRQPDPSR